MKKAFLGKPDAGEDPSDLDELLGTCTFKNADDMDLDGDLLEPFYVDTIPEEALYVWGRIYPATEEAGFKEGSGLLDEITVAEA